MRILPSWQQATERWVADEARCWVIGSVVIVWCFMYLATLFSLSQANCVTRVFILIIVNLANFHACLMPRCPVQLIYSLWTKKQNCIRSDVFLILRLQAHELIQAVHSNQFTAQSPPNVDRFICLHACGTVLVNLRRRHIHNARPPMLAYWWVISWY